MKLNSLQDLLLEQLQDLYDAEKQLVPVLNKMASAASNEELKKGFEAHVKQTEDHIKRLEEVFEQLNETARGKRCKAMAGLLEEGSEMLQMEGQPAVLDAGLIAAAQRVEHYEIAGYGTARAFAEQLGLNEAAKLLDQTLEEESATNEKLDKLAISKVNQAAADL